MRKALPHSFFNRPATSVARDLIGKVLVRKRGTELASLIITETEAYDGPRDLACHASRGRTARTEPMFDRAGTIYVYFVYGMHYMLNIVTGPKEYPAAVLIRGVRSENEIFTGPAKLTKRLRIDKAQNHKRLGRSIGLWIEDHGIRVRKSNIKKSPRIGVQYAGEWADKPYRFVLDDYDARRLRSR